MAKRVNQHDFEIEIEKLRLGADRFNGWMELVRLMVVYRRKLKKGQFALMLLPSVPGLDIAYYSTIFSSPRPPQPAQAGQAGEYRRTGNPFALPGWRRKPRTARGDSVCVRRASGLGPPGVLRTRHD
jgi:hypothetical protein